MSVALAAARGGEGDGGGFQLRLDPKKDEYVPGSLFREETDILVRVKILEDRALSAPDDPSLFRKLARARFKLWYLNLDQGAVAIAREAYQRALAIKENQTVPGLWAECGMVRARPLIVDFLVVCVCVDCAVGGLAS